MKQKLLRLIPFIFAFTIFHPSAQHLLAQERRILRICDLADDSGLRMDTHRQFDERNHIILNQIFEHLLEFDCDGSPSPNLAKSWRRLDDHTVQFRLNEGIFFHNGEPCDANAVKFSLERNLDPQLRSPSFHMVESIERVDVVDRYTFNIVTSYPDGILLNRLSQFSHIVPPYYIEMVGGKGFEKHPIGTGPFRFSKWVKGKELILEKNQSYWLPGIPQLDVIVFKFADARKRVRMLLEGEVDMTTNFEPVDIPKIVEKGFKVIREPSFTMLAINFNLLKENSPFKDRRVRQALNYAVDVDELIEKVMLGNGIRRATLGMPGEFGYNPYIKPYPHDPGKAKTLLRDAGYPNGFAASIFIDDIDGGKDSTLGRVLKQQLAAVGIRLHIEGGNGALRIVKPKLDHSAPAFDLDMFARTCPDPLAHILFIEGKVWYASESPWSLMRNPQFDVLYSRIMRTLDLRKQTRLCHELEEMIHREAFSLFTYQGIKLYAMRKKIEYNPYITGMLFLKDARITSR
jgi:peptide/nickel transport system substrate-binding protein